MDLFKAITGKNPAEFEPAAQRLVDTPDIELYKKLVMQEEFLFDFVKNNVAKRILNACNKNNYRNLLQFFSYYSSSYDNAIAEALHRFGGNDFFSEIKDFLVNGNASQKAYTLKFMCYLTKDEIEDFIPLIREASKSDYEPLSINAIEVLSAIKDNSSKEEALKQLKSDDEFEQYNAVKFLVNYDAKDALADIINIMKHSSLAENIAAEIPYLTDIENLIINNFDDGILVLCNIINAIPEIIPLSEIINYNLLKIFENLYYNNLTSTSALLLRMAKEKFDSLAENDEYLYECDKNTKSELKEIQELLNNINVNKLNSLLYDELYDGSDFVFYAVDFVNEVEELETLLDSSNQTLLLKVLTTMKEKQMLKIVHKEQALNHITSENIKQIIDVL